MLLLLSLPSLLVAGRLLYFCSYPQCCFFVWPLKRLKLFCCIFHHPLADCCISCHIIHFLLLLLPPLPMLKWVLTDFVLKLDIVPTTQEELAPGLETRITCNRQMIEEKISANVGIKIMPTFWHKLFVPLIWNASIKRQNIRIENKRIASNNQFIVID